MQYKLIRVACFVSMIRKTETANHQSGKFMNVVRLIRRLHTPFYDVPVCTNELCLNIAIQPITFRVNCLTLKTV